MQINDIHNKDELSAILINELKEIGVKYRKEKKSKVIQEKTCRRRIFRTHLHMLELTDVFLASGSVVQIPKFVADACTRILEQVETEGIFRKAGSSIRQKEIRISLEAGLPLGKSHHVIDVANVVKSFFRELPESLIPPSMQETLLRSLLIGERHVKAILLTCLLLPPLTINTLSFFMQFLRTVSISASANKMSIENLAIIFTPGLMPFGNNASHRFTNHVKMVQLLIENANAIGTVPESIVNKLQNNEDSLEPTSTKIPVEKSFDLGGTACTQETMTQKKKKKRRSGSLTQMFHGLRKIVGSAIGSSENLERTPENITSSSSNPCTADAQRLGTATPCRQKLTKKRKFTDPVSAFSAKKKKDLLALLPSNSGGFLPNTPLTKESKKSRLSLGGNRHLKTSAISNPIATSMERRWSIVGSGWSRQKNKTAPESKNNNNCHSIDSLIDVPQEATSSSSEKYSLKINSHKSECIIMENIRLPEKKFYNDASTLGYSDEPRPEDYHGKIVVAAELKTDRKGDKGDKSDCVGIFKNEYEAIKERVAVIETRISQEFETICDSLTMSNRRQCHRQSRGVSDGIGVCIARRSSSFHEDNLHLSGPERVQDVYEQMMVQNEALCSPVTEQLAQRLSRGLKIRRSIEQRVIRSPSARKIGTMRRRSQEKVRLTRNQTWHFSGGDCNASPAVVIPPNSFYAKKSLKRGRPNTLHTGLIQQQQYATFQEDVNDVSNVGHMDMNISPQEQWTSGELFFDDQKQNHSMLNAEYNKTLKQLANMMDISTPTEEGYRSLNSMQMTPMLPPKSVSRKQVSTNRYNGLKPPISSTIKSNGTSSSEATAVSFSSCIDLSTSTDEEVNGRASIARLRTQNAGMVMAKAKLFDGLSGSSEPPIEPHTKHSDEQLTDNALMHATNRQTSFSISASATLAATVKPQTLQLPQVESGKSQSSPNSSRRMNIIAKSPGSIKKRQHLTVSSKYSPYKQALLLNSFATNEKLIQTSRQPSDRQLYQGHQKGSSSSMIMENGKVATAAVPRTPRTHIHLNANSPRRTARNNKNKSSTTPSKVRFYSPSRDLTASSSIHLTHRSSPRFAKSRGGR